jgi:Zn-dependent protease
VAIPAPGEGARGLVSFRLLGVPVSIHASFLVVVFLLGASNPESARIDLAGGLVWAAVVTMSVLAHELGHALTARPAGGQPRIDLFGIAGLTRWNPARAGRGRRVAVSLAGVAAGVVLGVVMLAVRSAVAPEPGTLLDFALFAAVYANLAWGLLNLLPMLPLDGGQVVRAVMPGKDDATRDMRTAAVSVVVAAVVAVAAVLTDHPIAAAFVVFFAAGNVQTLLAARRLRGAPDLAGLVERANAAMEANRPHDALELLRGVDHPLAHVISAAALIRLGEPRRAQDTLIDLPSWVTLEPTFEATVLLANGQERLARERLAATLRDTPAPWAVRELASLLHRRGDDVDAVLADVRGEAAVGVATALYFEGAYAASGRWAETALGSGVESPYVAYNGACAWARAGDLDRALRLVDHALLLGWTDAATLDTDEDLAPVRAHAGWAAVRARLGEADDRH